MTEQRPWYSIGPRLKALLAFVPTSTGTAALVAAVLRLLGSAPGLGPCSGLGDLFGFLFFVTAPPLVGSVVGGRTARAVYRDARSRSLN